VALSLEVLLVVLAQCAIAVLVGLGLGWLLKYLNCPEEPAKYIMIAVWIIVGVFVLVKLLRLAGIA
jgi:hypothetical protein